MKAALFGSSGQVGLELAKVVPMVAATTPFTRDDVDFSEPDSVRSFARALDVDLIINAAAYTSVDKAEDQPDLADRINHKSVLALAEVAKDRKIRLIHYSTDYVFDGTKKDSYNEEDQASPLGVYGATKLAGERAIVQTGCSHIVLRTSWVYSSHGSNFLKTILKLAESHEKIQVVNDQKGKPTSARQIAESTIALIKQIANGVQVQGLFHFAGTSVVSRYEFASEIISLAHELQLPVKCDIESVLPISTGNYPTRAKRPANAVLSTEKLQPIILKPLLNLREELRATLKIIATNG